jgi:hypothetical protein
MKTFSMRMFLTAMVAALAASIGTGRAAGIPPFNEGATYTQTFDTGGSATNFSGSGSVASWIYWFNIPGGNTQMTNDVSLDVFGDPNSGSLIYATPWNAVPVTTNTQNVIFGTFGNQFGYDTGTAGDMTPYDDINFYIRVDPSAPARRVGGTNVDYGDLNVGFFYPYSFEVEGSVTIPLSASNNWVHLTVPINPSSSRLTGINGIAFGVSSFDANNKYLLGTNSVFYLDNVQVQLGCECGPPTLGAPYKPVSGFNAIATTAGMDGQYYDYQIVTEGDTGYSFVGQPSATYSWTIKSFPTNTGGNFQQEFEIISGPFLTSYPEGYMPELIWVTVHQSDAGVATMNFLLETNDMPAFGITYFTSAALNDSHGAAGTWSMNIQNNTNITITSPGGLSTNFSITAAQAALFADPCRLALGARPNNPNGAGKAVVYSSFSVSGVASPFTDNFLTDTSFDTNLWMQAGNDTNGVVLVPANAAWWVPWTLPDIGYVLVTKADLSTPGGFSRPNPLIIRNGGGTVQVGQFITSGVDQALILSNQLTDPMQGYFQLVQYHATMLQVLFAGETNSPTDAPSPQRFTPNTSLGYTGTASPISGASTSGAVATVTVNAVDPSYNIVTSVTDTVTLTSSDPGALEPPPAALVSGTLTMQVIFYDVGNWTVTATDTSDPAIAAGTSSSITVNP